MSAEQPAPKFDIPAALAEFFDPTEVKFKPAVVSGNRAMALAYVDVRVIQDRLDDVLGVEGWQDDYECREDGSVICRLRLRIGGEWIQKVDVGSQSEQPDGGDRMKAAFSDALKRAAVKFGVGRYLYRLPHQWVDYDAQKRAFARTPTLPAMYLPQKKGAPAAAPAQQPAAAPAASKPAAKAPTHSAPASGAEFQRRLYDYDAKLATQGVCAPGELVKHVVASGVKAGQEADLSAWDQAGIALAAEETKAFESRARKPRPGKKPSPSSGEEFYERVLEAERVLVGRGRYIAGQLVRELAARGEAQRPPYPQLLANWNQEQFTQGCKWVREIDAKDQEAGKRRAAS